MPASDNIELNMGFSDCMGENLRDFVERQLVDDLNVYVFDGSVFNREDIAFDWSESCIEGHRTSYLDGEVENFSGIALFDTSSNLIAEGWMDFVETEKSLIVFWWFLDAGEKYEIREKKKNGIPPHIWENLDSKIKLGWKDYAPKTRYLP